VEGRRSLRYITGFGACDQEEDQDARGIFECCDIDVHYAETAANVVQSNNVVMY